MSMFCRSHLQRFSLVLALVVLGALVCALLLPGELRSVDTQLMGFPDSDRAAHQARPIILTALCFLPALAGLSYCFGGILDRYIIRQFLSIFAICLATLFLIWLLMSMADKIGDFRNVRHMGKTMWRFYLTSVPYVLLLLLPYCLLLALLQSLGKLSTNREIVAIIQSGRGVIRMALPLILAGGWFSLFCLGLNYHWAPISDGRQDEIIAEAAKDTPKEEKSKTPRNPARIKSSKASHVLYRNPENRRLWMIGNFPVDYQKGKPLLNVEVSTTGTDHKLESRLTASSARWDLTKHQWTFENAVVSHYQPGQAPKYDLPVPELTIDSWSETPWQLIKPGLRPEYLGIPDLNGWLQASARHARFADPAPYRSQWHYRWALPFSCLVTVLLATPLAIHFSRRGAGGGVFVAVLLSAMMLLAGNISLAFGESGKLNPALSAWLPNATFGLLGIYLCWRRIAGRPIYQTLYKLVKRDD